MPFPPSPFSDPIFDENAQITNFLLHKEFTFQKIWQKNSRSNLEKIHEHFRLAWKVADIFLPNFYIWFEVVILMTKLRTYYVADILLPPKLRCSTLADSRWDIDSGRHMPYSGRNQVGSVPWTKSDGTFILAESTFLKVLHSLKTHQCYFLWKSGKRVQYRTMHCTFDIKNWCSLCICLW